MKMLLLSMMLCVAWYAAAGDPARAEKSLVSITYSDDDKAPGEAGHTEHTLYITQDKRRWARSSWGEMQGGEFPLEHGGNVDANADNTERAAECLKLLRTLPEPQNPFTSPSRVVTVRCMDGRTELVKRFDEEHMPKEVLQMLHVMRIPGASLNNPRFKFVDDQPEQTLPSTAKGSG